MEEKRKRGMHPFHQHTVGFQEAVSNLHVHERVEHLRLGDDDVFVIEKGRIVHPKVVRDDGEETIGRVKEQSRGVGWTRIHHGLSR